MARARGEAGTVTAELAIGLVAVVLVLCALVVTASASSSRVRCIDAARAGARVAALGASDAEVAAAVRHLVPDARVDVDREPPWVEVDVARPLAGAWFARGGFTVTGSATAWVEP